MARLRVALSDVVGNCAWGGALRQRAEVAPEAARDGVRSSRCPTSAVACSRPLRRSPTSRAAPLRSCAAPSVTDAELDAPAWDLTCGREAQCWPNVTCA